MLLATGQVLSAIRPGGQGGGLTNRFGRDCTCCLMPLSMFSSQLSIICIDSDTYNELTIEWQLMKGVQNVARRNSRT